MSRDELLGYFLYKPETLDKETKIKIKKLTDSYKKFLKEKNLTERLDNEEASLMNLLPKSYWDSVSEVYENFPTEEIIEDIPVIINFLETLDWEQLDSNDTNKSTIKVLDKEIGVYFSGGSTYGDEPETQGYLFIKTVIKSGLWNILYESCFPQLQSIHFIKNLNKLKE